MLFLTKQKNKNETEKWNKKHVVVLNSWINIWDESIDNLWHTPAVSNQLNNRVNSILTCQANRSWCLLFKWNICKALFFFD